MRNFTSHGAAEEKSDANPALSEVAGNNVSPKAVIAPVTATARSAKIDVAQTPASGPAKRIPAPGRAPHHAVKAIAATSSIVLIKCADRYTTRPAETSAPA